MPLELEYNRDFKERNELYNQLKCLNSEINSSENKKEVLKCATQAVFQLLKENRAYTDARI